MLQINYKCFYKKDENWERINLHVSVRFVCHETFSEVRYQVWSRMWSGKSDGWKHVYELDELNFLNRRATRVSTSLSAGIEMSIASSFANTLCITRSSSTHTAWDLRWYRHIQTHTDTHRAAAESRTSWERWSVYLARSTSQKKSGPRPIVLVNCSLVSTLPRTFPRLIAGYRTVTGPCKHRIGTRSLFPNLPNRKHEYPAVLFDEQVRAWLVHEIPKLAFRGPYDSFELEYSPEAVRVVPKWKRPVEFRGRLERDADQNQPSLI